MTTRTGRGLRVPQHIRDAAVADYEATGDTLTAVAERHGVSRSALSHWTTTGADIAYRGGWHPVGLVQRPLLPEQRSA